MVDFEVIPSEGYIVGEPVGDVFDDDKKVYNNTITPGIVNPGDCQPVTAENEGIMQRYGTDNGIVLLSSWASPEKIPGTDKVLIEIHSIRATIKIASDEDLNDEDQEEFEFENLEAPVE
ncbi:MAG: hypothetical protein ACTSW1_08495 [Candidatus Hodarchaeales archaeon]